MPKFIKIILIIVAVIAFVVIGGNTIKTDVKVERSIELQASVEQITQQVADFKNFRTWSPWSAMDTNSTFEIKGEPCTVGHLYSWSGNDQVGTGIQVIESISPERIDLKLTFTAPWESESKVYYTFDSSEKSTMLTWGYEGELPIMMSLFIDMDEMLGGNYETGLASLKNKLEK